MNKNYRLDKLEGESRREDVFIRVIFRDDISNLYSDSFEDDAEWLAKDEVIKNYLRDKMIKVPGIGESPG
jgi:hypothetical protein